MDVIGQGLGGRPSYLAFESPQGLLLRDSLCPLGWGLLIVLPLWGSGEAAALGLS